MRFLLKDSALFLECSLILAMFLPWWGCYGGDLISTTCDQTPNYNLCITTLKKDPRSRKADVAGLGMIMIEAAEEKANATVELINKVGSESSSVVKNALMECRENYKVLLKSNIPKAIQFLKRNEKFAAESAMAASAIEADGCEKSLKSSKSTTSQLIIIEMNEAVYDLSNIARSIIKAILNGTL